MNISVIFQFLDGIAAHNNREWFNTHRDLYESAREEFEKLLSILITRISKFDESVRGIEARDCTYRIYRDTRFSEDKTPYKTHMGGYINARGKKSDHCGYYIHLQPGHCMVAGGSYCPPPPLLKALRQAVYDNIDEFRSIVEDPAFSRYFPVVGEKFLKTAPKGFPKDFPYIKYLRCKEYTIACPLPDSFFIPEVSFDHLDDILRQVKRFADFMNYTIDDFE